MFSSMSNPLKIKLSNNRIVGITTILRLDCKDYFLTIHFGVRKMLLEGLVYAKGAKSYGGRAESETRSMQTCRRAKSNSNSMWRDRMVFGKEGEPQPSVRRKVSAAGKVTRRGSVLEVVEKMEPTIGVEPMTCRLRIGCSTN